ncbi:phage portal protein [Ciceribacter sp. L1K23]|uniref:phage portal protein n=1 Tax=Ciceribacter sp. L1K23 TaxID=2820276 RepID=UPI001B81C647|nr:phage portal protein [Ciceribacter sp. L1K23]MBR0556368.1 phage portal protein [Ciceribacter sp. L1K23]
MRLPFWRRREAARTSGGPGATKALGALAWLTGEATGKRTAATYGALARAGFLGNPVAHRCVRLVAEAAASVPWLVYRGETELSGHPVLELMRAPNAKTAGVDFLEALYGQLLISGNAFVEPVKLGARLAELHLLRPDRVSVAEGRDGWPVGYDYRAGGTTRRIPADGEGALLHLKLFHPLDDHLGFPPLGAAIAALDLSNAAARWNKALIDNSARPSGALVYQPKEGGNLSVDQYERLKAELDDGYSGAMNAGRPLLLEGGLDWKAMGLSPRDMDFEAAKNGAARDVALAFGVPPMLLGIPGDNTYANYQEANRAFWRLTVLPLTGRTAEAFSGFLAGTMGEAFRLVPDLDRAAGLSVERDALWARVGAATFLTDAEKRAAVGY